MLVLVGWFFFFRVMKNDLQHAVLETVEKYLSKTGFICLKTTQLKFLVSTSVFCQKENFTSSNPFLRGCSIKGLDIVLETPDVFLRFAGVQISFYPIIPSHLEFKTHFIFQHKLNLMNITYYVHRCCRNIKN